MCQFDYYPKIKDKGIKRKNKKTDDKGPTQKKQQHENKGGFFCNKEGYTKNECTKAIRNFRLSLEARFYLNFKNIYFCCTIFRRNLVLVYLLDKFGYSCSFENNQFHSFLNFNIVGTSFLKAYDSLFMIEAVASYNETLHVKSRGIKHNFNKENSASL